VEDRLSAQVVLRPASGELAGDEPITSENVRRFLPSLEAITETETFFRDAGFEVANAVGNSFAIVGAPSAFERAFGERPERAGEGVRVEGGVELDLGSLPERVGRHVQAVTFTPPPEFGPANP
jgi:hypothetical protein